MTDSMDLELGAQTEAAQLVAEGAERIIEIYDDLIDTVATEMTSLRGGAAAAMGADVEAWLTSASRLPAALTEYAANLAAVDLAVAKAEGVSTSALQDAYSSSGSGLNMGDGHG